MPLEVEEADKLEVQGPRDLSDLEEEAVNLVFVGHTPPGVTPTEIISDVQLEIVENIPRTTKPWLLKVPSIYTYDDEYGLITISKSAFPYTQGLNKNSTYDWVDSTLGFRDRKRTDRFRPGNMHYLSTVLFECAHHWQQKYGLYTNPGLPGDPPYHFNQEELKDLRLYSEQHASAAQVYFLIRWQIRYKGFPVDLTSQPSDSPNSVGPVNRYTRIYYDFLQKGQHLLGREDALSVQDDFSNYRSNLADRGEQTPCKKSTQETWIDPTSQFYNPLQDTPVPRVPPGAIALAGGGWIDPKKMQGGGP